MKENKGFTFLEIIISLSICAIILVVLIPNILNQYYNLSEQEKKLELKEILYEEIIKHNNKEFVEIRDNYVITVTSATAKIEDISTNYVVSYEK